MPSSIVYGFLDESPSLSDKDYFFCVDIITSEEKVNNNLHKIIKKAREKIIKKKLKNIQEIKFHTSDEKTRIYILSELAKQDVEIFVLVADKEGRKVEDTPRNYAIVVGVTVAELLKFHPRLSLTVDKKYTNPKQQEEFIKESDKTIFKFGPKNISLIFNNPADSEREKTLQLADFVVGAFNSKYNQRDAHYTEIIKEKIKSEKIVKWVKIKRRMVNP